MGDYFHIKNNNNDEEEMEDTLSFSDLPLYSSRNSADWDNLSLEDQSFFSSPSSHNSDLFEFFIPNGIRTNHPNDNVLFCGKVLNTRNPKVESKSKLARKNHPKAPHVFGVTRIATEMGLSEMRRRQSNKAVEIEKKGVCSERKKRKEKRLWGVVAALSCGGTLSTAILVTSVQSNKSKTTRVNA